MPLYNGPLDLSFHAMQRVQEKHVDAVSCLFGNIYLNQAEAFVGLNASGKTRTLNVISFALSLLAAKPLNSVRVPMLWNDEPVIFDIYFFHKDKLYRLKTKIIRRRSMAGAGVLSIESENLWVKPANTKINKSNLFDFENLQPYIERSSTEKYLLSDVSIMVALNKEMNDEIKCMDLSGITFSPDYIVVVPQ